MGYPAWENEFAQHVYSWTHEFGERMRTCVACIFQTLMDVRIPFLEERKREKKARKDAKKAEKATMQMHDIYDPKPVCVQQDALDSSRFGFLQFVQAFQNLLNMFIKCFGFVARIVSDAKFFSQKLASACRHNTPDFSKD